MFTEPKIVLTEDLKVRGYVTFYFNTVRYREYSGTRLNLTINPNQFKTYKDRLKSLNKLCYEFTKALNDGWNPTGENEIQSGIKESIQLAFNKLLKAKQDSDLSIAYKKDLTKVKEQFLAHLSPIQCNNPPSEINHNQIEAFLNQFSSTATYYMNKRRALNVFFSEFKRIKLINENPVEVSRRQKQKAKAHKTYSNEQLHAVLGYLKEYYPTLYICCMLVYGCLLRPHQEVRLLALKHFQDDFSRIILSGSENKSKRVRVINVPDFVKVALIERFSKPMNVDTNVLSKCDTVFNVSYLNTQWSRAKKKMIALSIIQSDHTIYSFRHTAAVNVYKKTKDLHILQSLLQHSNMIVTLGYLRGLGEATNEDLKNAMPEL